MITELTIQVRLLLGTLAVWRLTHLLVAEDGPWDFVFRLRKKLGNSIAGKAMDCFYCCSIWVAVPFTFFITTNWLLWLLSWLALSGAACLLEQATTKQNNQ